MVMIEYGAGARPPRDLMRAMLRGFAQRCPDCGKGNDAPPYFTILIVGHFIVGGVLALEKGLAPPTWVHLSIWLPLTLIASLWLLPRVKGALVGLQWALYMHGFEQAQPPSEKPML